MSTAELKLALFRAIDRLPEARLRRLLQEVKEEADTPAEEPPHHRPRRLGALQGGLIYMAPDFDAPLEDFKDYM